MQFINPKQDRWHALSGEDGPIVTLTPAPYSLLTLLQWHSVRAHWPQDVPVGVVLANDVEVTEIAAELPRLALVALDFPKWTDGRAYSQARVLRTRYRYTGQVRATGEVLVDMLPLMQRTGFDAVVLRADQSLDVAERALAFFPAYYQGDVHERRPVFGRSADELKNATQVEFIQQGSSI